MFHFNLQRFSEDVVEEGFFIPRRAVTPSGWNCCTFLQDVTFVAEVDLWRWSVALDKSFGKVIGVHAEYFRSEEIDSVLADPIVHTGMNLYLPLERRIKQLLTIHKRPVVRYGVLLFIAVPPLVMVSRLQEIDPVIPNQVNDAMLLG